MRAHRRKHVPSHRQPRRGVVLLAVLVVVVLLTLAAYQFTELMGAEQLAADSYKRSVQAKAFADSGIHYAAVLLSNADAFATQLNGNPYESPQNFQAVLVQQHDIPRFQGRFSILAPVNPDEGSSSTGFRFGVTDESGKINLNALLKLDSSGQVAHDILLRLPNMTEEIANAILDWIDPDDDPRASGAESDVYSSQNPPYRCKNGLLDSLEELLLVRGVTPQLLFGNDRNRNGILDADEDDGNGLDRGWSVYLTIYSRERNLDIENNPRIYINDPDLQTLSSKLSTALGQELANYIIAYRMYGPAQSQQQGGGTSGGGGSTGGSGTSGGGSTSGGASTGGARTSGGGTGSTGSTGGSTPSTSAPATAAPANAQAAAAQVTQNLGTFTQGRARSIASLYELVNSSVSVPSNNSGQAGGGQGSQQGQGTQQNTTISYPSPLNDPSNLEMLLPTLLDKVTTVRDTELPARVNVNTAPREVLLGLPGLSEADVQSILDNRPSTAAAEAPDPIFETPAWLLTDANLSVDTLRTLERYITARSQVYRVQSVGYFDGGGPTARIEAVIDTNGGRPRIIYWRDLTELGKGFNLQNGQ